MANICFSSRRRHTRWPRDWSSDVCSSDLRRISAMPSDKAIVHVIDDDDAVRESLAFLLGTAGIDVQTYESAVAFLDVAPKVKLGCVITDVRMPELSGVDLLRRLRELKLGVPVIVIPGH